MDRQPERGQREEDDRRVHLTHERHHVVGRRHLPVDQDVVGEGEVVDRDLVEQPLPRVAGDSRGTVRAGELPRIAQHEVGVRDGIVEPARHRGARAGTADGRDDEVEREEQREVADHADPCGGEQRPDPFADDRPAPADLIGVTTNDAGNLQQQDDEKDVESDELRAERKGERDAGQDRAVTQVEPDREDHERDDEDVEGVDAPVHEDQVVCGEQRRGAEGQP